MILENIEKYDGSYLKRRFAYDHFLDKTQPIGNIIAFRSPINIDSNNLVDKDDIIKNKKIMSSDAINFCIEIPNITPYSGVCFHRLYNTYLGNILASDFLKCDIQIDGSSIIIHKETNEYGLIRTKGNATITDISFVDNAVLIHTGIHINVGEPFDVNAFSTRLTDDECIIFMRKGIEIFYSISYDIFLETTKKVNK